MPNMNAESHVAAYKEIYDCLKQKGFTPTLNVLDDQCSKLLKTWIIDEKRVSNMWNQKNHRVNAAERAIQTFKTIF